MRARAFLAPLLLLAEVGWAQTQFSPNLQVTGQVGVGTNVPRGRAEVRQGASDDYSLKVSSPNGAFLSGLEKGGRLGIGVSAPEAKVDVRGTGDAGEIGLQLRSGNSSSTVSASQLVLAYDGEAKYGHGLRTRHAAAQQDYNTMDFFLWRSTAEPDALGEQYALSLQAVSSVSSGSVHVNPAGIGAYELEVSSGTGLVGGGVMTCASVGTHSSRALKSGVEPLAADRKREGYEAVKGLKHVRFRYKLPSGRAEVITRRGLIFEEAPASIQGAHKSLVVDQRVLNLELALQLAQARVEALERELSSREKRR